LDSDQKLKIFDLLLNDQAAANKAYDFAKNIALKTYGKPAVNSQNIAYDVYYDLNNLDYESLSDHKSRNKYGHVDHVAAMCDKFEEIMEPYFDDLGKSIRFGYKKAAKSCCIGIIWGLFMFNDEGTSDLREMLEGLVESYVGDAVKAWKKGQPSEKDIAEVMAIVEAQHYDEDDEDDDDDDDDDDD
jgi:hypothetical protein